MRRWQSALVWAPLLVLAAVRVALLVTSLVGQAAFWSSGAMTLSEAAAYRDGGEVARQLEAGANPNAVFPVRRGAVRGRIEATPIEAAEAAGRGEIVQLLREAGATK